MAPEAPTDVDDQGEATPKTGQLAQSSQDATPKAPNTTTAQPERTSESLSVRERLVQTKAGLQKERSGKPTKISQVVDWLIQNRTEIIPKEKIEEIMGRDKIDPREKLKIAGLQRPAFQKANIHFRRNMDGSMTVVKGNPHHKKWQDQQPQPTEPQPPEEPEQPDTRAPYTTPTAEEIDIKIDSARQRELTTEALNQLWQASLATRDEVRAALASIMSKSRVVGNTTGGVKRDDGTPINTMIYLLEKFAEGNPITQEKLQRGFPNLQSLQTAKGNANNSKDNIIRSSGLHIESTRNLREPGKGRWRMEAKKVIYTNKGGPTVDQIYTNAQRIRENDSLFVDAPKFSQFIVGALTDLRTGATFEEISVVTGLSEEDILRAVSHINESIISPDTDIKIHNRNGILIFGTRKAQIPQVDTRETRIDTVHWKAVVAEMRARVQTTMTGEPTSVDNAAPAAIAATPEAEEPTTIAELEDAAPAKAESIPQATLEKLSTVLINKNIKGASRKFLETLLKNGGEMSRTEASRIREEADTISTFTVFIGNKRNTIKNHGLTLELGPDSVKIATLNKPAEVTEQTTEPAEAEPAAPSDAEPASKGPFKITIDHESMLGLMMQRVEELQGELERAQTELAQLKEDKATSAEALQKAQIKITNLTTQLGEANRTIRELDVQLAEKASELATGNAREIAGMLELSQTRLRAAGAEQRESAATARAERAESRATAAEQAKTTAESALAELRKQAPAADLLARVRSANDTIAARDATIAELSKTVEAADEVRRQARAIAARDARRDTRVEVTAEFERKIAEKDEKIAAFKKTERDLNARIASLQARLAKPANEQVAEIQRELEKAQRDLTNAQSDLEKEKKRAENAATTAVSSEALTSAQREITDLRAKLEAAEEAKKAAEARATAAESQPRTVIQATTVVGPTSSTEFLASRRLEGAETRATAAESRAATAERKLKTAQEEATRLRAQLEAAQRVKPAPATPAPKLKSPAQETLEQLREAKRQLQTAQAEIKRLEQALQGKRSEVITMEKKGGLDAMREEIKTLKKEVFDLRQAQTSSPAAEAAQTALTIKDLQDKLATVRKQLEASKKREEALAKLVGEDEEPEAEGDPKTKKKIGKGKAGPGIKSEEMSAEARAAAAAQVAATLAKNAAKAKGPEFKDLTKIEETLKNPDARSVPMSIFEKISGELNGLDFSEESLNAFVKKLSDIATAIAENKNLSRDPRAVRIGNTLKDIIKYIKTILSIDSTDFTPQRKSGMIKGINRLIDEK